MGHAGGVERGLYAVERARADHGALAVHDQGAAISGFRQLGADRIGDAAAKYELGGGAEGEIVHGCPFPSGSPTRRFLKAEVLSDEDDVDTPIVA